MWPSKHFLRFATCFAITLLTASIAACWFAWRDRSCSNSGSSSSCWIKRHREQLLTSDELLYVFGARHHKLQPAGPLWTTRQQYLHYVLSHVTRPSPGPRRLKHPPKEGEIKHYSQPHIGQSRFVDKLLRGRCNGFFIECGAWDGEDGSNSLFFELHRNWTGLLVEAHPERYVDLLDKNRNVYTFGGCLSPSRRPSRLIYGTSDVHYIAGVVDHMVKSYAAAVKSGKTSRNTTITCFPLSDILTALGINQVDYFSLDVDGAELQVLQTIDFHQLRVDVLSVEFNAQLPEIRAFFNETGLYRELAIVANIDIIVERLDINKAAASP